MFSNTLSFLSSRNVSDQVPHPYKTTGKVRVFYITILVKILCPSVLLGWIYERKINRGKWSTAGITPLYFYISVQVRLFSTLLPFTSTYLCKSGCSAHYSPLLLHICANQAVQHIIPLYFYVSVQVRLFSTLLPFTSTYLCKSGCSVPYKHKKIT
jgi:hypothetical protein